jgi:hypothetical protein
VTISPDGTTIAFTAGNRIYLQSLSDFEPRIVAGAERAISPAFSPDSQALAFWADGEIKRIAVGGGVPVSLYRTGTSSAPSSLTWGDSGILFPTATGIMRLSPDDGKPEVLVPLSVSDGFAHGPQLLPDDETLLFTLTTDSGASTERWENARIVAHSLETGTREVIIEPGTDIPAPGKLMVLSITSQKPAFTFTNPESVLRGFGISGPLNQRMFDIMRDGRILGLASPTSAPSTPTDLLQMHVVVNWFEELKQGVPTK